MLDVTVRIDRRSSAPPSGRRKATGRRRHRKMAADNSYSRNGGIYVGPSGLSPYYPVPGFSHGCKSLSPSASLTMHSYNSYKPSTRAMAPLSPLQIIHHPSSVMSYNNSMLNSHQTSSFAAALRKLAKQAGEPSAEDSLLSTNSIVNQSAVMSQMYINNQQGAFSNNFSSSITSSSLPSHNGGSKKGIETSAFSLAITNNNHMPDSLRVKYGSLNHPLCSGRWEEHYIGTKDLTSSAQITASVSIPSTTTENVSGRGFQPYKLMEERKHISSQFSFYDTPYAYSSNFISSPQVSSHTYKLEDAFYLEHYGLVRAPMMHISSAQKLIPNPHTAFYHTGTYSSELLTQHMEHSTANILFEHKRLKREQRVWTENKELPKIKEWEIDKVKVPGVRNDLSPISFSKELSDKRRDSSAKDVNIQKQENKTSICSGSHSALLNFTARPKIENKQDTNRDVSILKKTDYSCLEKFENNPVEPSNDIISLSNLQNIKNATPCVNSNNNKDNNNSSVFFCDKNELTLHCQKNYEESSNVEKECNSPDKSSVEPKHNMNRVIIPNILEKKLQSFELKNFVNNLQIPATNYIQNTDNYQLYEQYSKIISKLDLEELKLKSKSDDYNDDETDSDEEKKYNYLQIILKGPPLPLDISPKKLKFLKQFNLITEKKKREIDFKKFLARREKLKETCVSPAIETEMETESKNRISSYCNYFVPVLVDKTTFMKVLNLHPTIDGNNKFELKKIERTVLDDAVLQNNMLNYTNLYDKESILRGIPLVHSTHLYKDYVNHSAKHISNLFSANVTSSVKLDSLSKFSKRHRCSKLWIPKHKKQKVKTDRFLLGRYRNSQDEKPSKNMELIGYTMEKSQTSSGYHWPGIEILMESYRNYVVERNLEQEILEERCHALKIQNRWLSAKLEKKKNCMMKLMEKKKWLEKKNKMHKTAIDNLKRFLKELT